MEQEQLFQAPRAPSPLCKCWGKVSHPPVGADPRVCPCFGVLSVFGRWRADTGVCPYVWLSWFRVGVLALAERVFSHHRTTVPPNSVPSYPHTSVPPRNTIHIPPPWGKATGRRALLGMGPGWGAGPLFPLRQSGSHSAGWLTRFSQRQAFDTDDALGALIFRQRGK